MSQISRRKLVVGAGAAGLGSLILLKIFIDPNAQALSELSKLLSENAYASAIAADVLKVLPCTKESLHRDLTRSVAAIREAGFDLTAEDLLGKLLRSDFNAGRVLEISGWIVAESEAKAYAFLKLSQGEG